ncbi:MAG: IS1182 family transposase [Actinobacteria bacterium]|nr:IS1182 family transposase [Actinomycetota bacterium]MBA3575153.1 IS1182 family transposase [Pseudonocardiales bacterium]
MADTPPVRGVPRVAVPIRNQVELQARDLESLVADDHPVRAVWAFVCGLDLSKLYDKIEAVEGGPGRPASDPAVLFALWLFATINAVGSARQLDRLTREHDAYRWLRGGVPVDYHLLAEFRVAHPEVLEEQLVSSVAALIASGLVTLKELAQDGVRVRASAGSGSYRTEAGLIEALRVAEQRVEALREQLASDPAGSSRGEAAARQRAAQERVERINAALARLPELRARKNGGKKAASEQATGVGKDGSEGEPGSTAPPASTPPEPGGTPAPGSPPTGAEGAAAADVHAAPAEAPAAEGEPPTVKPRGSRLDASQVRASTTDPEADVMKLADNGFRPAYNAQSCTDTATGIVVAVAVSDLGSDAPHFLPMLDIVEAAYDRLPERHLLDGGYTSLASIEAAAERGVTVYMPPPKPRGTTRGRYEPRAGDSKVIADWRERMGTADAAAIYRRRCSTAEWVNAQYRNHGLQQFNVRGKAKARAVVLWHAIANNMQVASRLASS